MPNKYKTKRRKDFLNGIMKILKEHEILNVLTDNKSDSEYSLQKALFTRLHKELPLLISQIMNIDINKSKSLVDNNFKYESNNNKSTHVSGFTFFGTNHRPDADLEVSDILIAFEVKKGNKGDALRSGIGQSIVYSKRYDFVLYFFVDTTSTNDIKRVTSGVEEKELISQLWNEFNIIFTVV
ncbi:MAG: hypothetical protein K9J27_09015 [Bacteroidales bacterium]|nr:hypothetical protein [Bacteroidales bacterium]MCF8333854.1 hypothetical protein [Bacteroidales bacterium]